ARRFFLGVRASGSAGLGLLDIAPDVLRHDVERRIAAEHHCVVESLEIVGIAQRLLRTDALSHDLAVADLVAARLPGPGAVAIDFACHFVGMRAIALDEELPALL